MAGIETCSGRNGTLPAVVAFLSIIIISRAAFPQASSSGGAVLPILTNVHAIRTLTPDEAKLGYPVHLRAVVTYYGGSGWELFIQDSVEGIYVDTASREWPIREGDLIDLEGNAAPGFAPEIINARIRTLGKSTLPRARRATLESLLTGKEDGQWVEVEGILRSTSESGGRTALDLDMGSGRLRAEMPVPVPGLARMVDGKVVIRGVCGTMFNNKRQLMGVQLYVPNAAQVIVEERPPEDPYSIPVRPINTLLQFTPHGVSSHRIRVQGTVTLLRLGQYLFVRDETQGLYVRSGERIPLQVGDRVDVVGFPSVGQYTPVLEQAIYRRIDSGLEPHAVRITAAQGLQGDFDAELVEIEGELKDHLDREGEPTLVLGAGTVVFEAKLAVAESDRKWASLQNNSMVSLTGICSVQVGEDRVPRSFRILMRTPQDVRVLRKPPWWTVRRAVSLLSMIAALSLVAIGWVIILRRRVQRQTGIIRERLEREAALEKRFQYVSRATNDAVWDLDLKSNNIWWNEAVQSLFGYEEHKIAPEIEWWSSKIHPEDRERVNSSLAEAVAAGKAKWSSEYRFLCADGTFASVFDRGYVIHDENGRPVRMIGAMMDITPQKEAQEALLHAKEAAESANRAKSDFLANMSHEIRTPMNGILGTTELLLDTDLTPEQREYLGMVKTSADSLLTVINDILDFSKIEAGKLDLDHAEFELRHCLEETTKTFALRAHSKDLELACDISPDTPDRVVGDPTRLRQIIVNLLGNAVKFTERGEIVLKVEKVGAADSKVAMHFSVRDTGIGIPPDKKTAIFDAFAQADSSMTRRYGGTGLGLTISARLVEMMRGRIWVESEVGRGSDFHFEAMFGAATSDVQPAMPGQGSLFGMSVLVVDDNETNRRILQATLERWGMRTSVADSAQAALSVLREAERAGNAFSLVLTDAQMPEVDGFELSEQIKQNGRLAGATIMMLTSGGQRGDAARCRELGVSAHLTKPVMQSELREAILKAAGISGSTSQPLQPAAAGTHAGNRQGLRILLAEDNTVNQVLVTRLLIKKGHKVTVVGDGKECLEALGNGLFDLLLLDVQMPEMDGFEAVRKIREMEKTTGHRLLVFALTAYAMSGDRERCLAAGMDDYLTKPIHAQILYEAIERHSMTVGA